MVSEELKKARRTAIVFGTLSGIALIAVVFGFVQKGIAEQNIQRTIKTAEEFMNCKKQVKELEMQTEQLRIEFQKKNEALEQELIALRNSRTK